MQPVSGQRRAVVKCGQLLWEVWELGVRQGGRGCEGVVGDKTVDSVLCAVYKCRCRCR